MAAIAPVVVALDGCYYAYKDLTFDLPVGLLDDKDAHIVLLGGQKDDVCAPWQSTRAARLRPLRSLADPGAGLAHATTISASSDARTFGSPGRDFGPSRGRLPAEIVEACRPRPLVPVNGPVAVAGWREGSR